MTGPELRAWLAQAPAGTSLTAAALLELLGDQQPAAAVPVVAPAPLELTWRERLWLVPAETRIGTLEACEALGRSRSWLYRQLGAASPPPHRKLDGELVFVVGELRAWLRGIEEVVLEGAMESTPGERRLYAIAGGAS